MRVDSLDFLYTPSDDVAADLRFYVDSLGAEAVFAIEAMGARVAEVRIPGPGPRLILADHLEGEETIPVFRVAGLEAALGDLEQEGFEIDARFGIPHGPCATLRTPGGRHLALYELTRPDADEHFAGRFDFAKPV